MSEKRVQDYFKKIDKIKGYLEAYHAAVKALRSAFPNSQNIEHIDNYLPIGDIKAWKCSNGIVALIFALNSNKEPFEFIDAQHLSIEKCLKSDEIGSLFDHNGLKSNRWSGGVTLYGAPNLLDAVFEAVNTKFVLDGETFTPLHSKLIVMGCNAIIPTPSEQAVNDFKSLLLLKNINQDQIFSLDQESRASEVDKCNKNDIESFKKLLHTAKNEESLQTFLRDNPRFIFPEFIEVYPKFKLGEEYITDFVYQIHGFNGLEYCFVEIEKASKEIFTKEGQLSANYTQAKHQLNTWDRWITQNIAYIGNKLPKLFKPRFLLIMGRNHTLSEENRLTIVNDLRGTNIDFCTFDDLIIRFETICNSILKSSL